VSCVRLGDRTDWLGLVKGLASVSLHWPCWDGRGNSNTNIQTPSSRHQNRQHVSSNSCGCPRSVECLVMWTQTEDRSKNPHRPRTFYNSAALMTHTIPTLFNVRWATHDTPFLASGSRQPIPGTRADTCRVTASRR